ncbi:MAG: ribonuclease P protein component [Candidatus Gracilibacteria bacterium]
MIASKYRLRDYEVERVFKRGRPFFGRLWSLHVLPDTRHQGFRMALSISRKHDKRSVWRNRYRRVMYDALLPLLKAGMAEQQKSMTPKGLQCIFVLKKGLKLTDVAVQEVMVADALALFEKATRQN